MKINNSVVGLLVYVMIGITFYFLCLKLGAVTLSSEVETLDAVVLNCAKFSLYATVCFLIGHLTFRKMQMTSRTHYSLLGAFAFLFVMWGLVPESSIQALRDSGLVTLGVIPPLLVGIMAGYLYYHFAGFAYDEYDADELGDVQVNEDGSTSTESLIASGTSEFYNGPLQVKTSFGALLIASVFGLILNDIVGGVMLLFPELISLVEGSALDHARSSDTESLVGNFNFVLINAVFDKIIFFIPYGFAIFVLHLIARGLNCVSYGAYLGVALAIPAVFALLVSPIPGMAAIVGGVFGVPIAIGIILYRNLAGVEPKSLPEDVIVTDKRTLVGKNHALRKYRRVVSNS